MYWLLVILLCCYNIVYCFTERRPLILTLVFIYIKHFLQSFCKTLLRNQIVTIELSQ